MNKILNLLSKTATELDLSRFYSVTFDSTELRLQGRFNRSLQDELLVDNYTQKIDESFLYFKKDAITVVLEPQEGTCAGCNHLNEKDGIFSCAMLKIVIEEPTTFGCVEYNEK